jgi:hypothetical protein
MELIHRNIIGTILILCLGALFGYLFAIFRLGTIMLKYTALDAVLVFSVAAPVLYAASRYSGIRGLMVAVVVLTVVHSIVFKYGAKEIHGQIVLYYFVSGMTVWFYQAYMVKALHGLRIGKFIVFAGLFVTAQFLVLVVERIFSLELQYTRLYIRAWSIGMFVAFGIGLGIELAELMIHLTVEPFADRGIIDDGARS